ncbi:hypothetical protein [Acidithiobacillus sulfuriphilus]|uniref:hypothetical protein n=1 Tax=Acidithiobacillus sulfuriphilus TaxID=1867749 RepID=UPI003F622E13
MGIRAKDFLDFARDLLSRGKGPEIFSRNAISRSYYAVYSNAVALRKQAGLPEYADMSSHKGLQESLKSHPNREYKVLATRLKIAHEKRVLADYCLDVLVLRDDAEQAFQLNEKIFADVDALLDGLTSHARTS